MPSPTINTTLRLDPKLKQLLKTHALLVRNIKLHELIVDVLRGWAVSVTDWEHPYFSKETLGFGRLPGPPSRYPGYIASLGFRDASFATDPSQPFDPSDDNPMRYHADHYSPVAESDEDELFVIDATELDDLRGKLDADS